MLHICISIVISWGCVEGGLDYSQRGWSADSDGRANGEKGKRGQEALHGESRYLVCSKLLIFKLKCGAEQ